MRQRTNVNVLDLGVFIQIQRRFSPCCHSKIATEMFQSFLGYYYDAENKYF